MIKTLTTFNLLPFVQFVINGVIEIFQKMEDIEFLGTNLLQFNITIIVLGILLPIIFTIPRGFQVSRSGRVSKEGGDYLPQHSHWAAQNRWMSRELADSGMKRSWWQDIKHGRSIRK